MRCLATLYASKSGCAVPNIVVTNTTTRVGNRLIKVCKTYKPKTTYLFHIYMIWKWTCQIMQVGKSVCWLYSSNKHHYSCWQSFDQGVYNWQVKTHIYISCPHDMNMNISTLTSFLPNYASRKIGVLRQIYVTNITILAAKRVSKVWMTSRMHTVRLSDVCRIFHGSLYKSVYSCVTRHYLHAFQMYL